MLILKDICKTFNPGTVNSVKVFSDLSLSVKKGEFVSIVGSNGSGKTTLLNLISGSIFPSSGSIFIDGRNITGLPEYRRSRTIGRVFQDPSKGTASGMTIYENMAIADNKGLVYGLSAGLSPKRKEIYRGLLSRLGMGLENKTDTLVGALSGGQRQALALLISTMTPIDMLLLDEHTAALDPKSGEAVMALTDTIIAEKQLTAVMVTHNLRFAVNYGSRLIMLNQGKIVLDKAGQDKKLAGVEQVLSLFNQISIECGN